MPPALDALGAALPLSREMACGLLQIGDDELPRLLSAALAAQAAL